MAQIDSMLVTLEEDTVNANAVKEVVLQRLALDGIITEEQQAEYASKWNVVIVKPSWFPSWKAIFSKSDNLYKYKYLKFEQ